MPRSTPHTPRWLVALLLLATASLAHAAPPLRPVSLQLKWYHQFQFAGYYAALQQGYYREAGLDVTLREGDPTHDPIADVVDGKADFGIGASELVLARAEGKPVVAVAVVIQHSPLILLAPRRHGIESFHDLIGKKIQLVPHEYELYALFQAMGYSQNDFQIFPRTNTLDELVSGQVDAVAAYSTDEPFELDQRHIQYLEITPRSAGIDFYGDTLFTSERLLRQSPDTVAAFREASLRGWAYALNHPEEIARLIRSRYSSAKSLDALLFEAQTLQRLIVPDLVELGYMNGGRWQHIAATYADLGMLPAGFDLSGFLYTPHPQVDLRWFYWSVAIAAGIALVGGSILLYILRLNVRLRASEQRYRVVYENAPMAFVTWDAERRVTGWNRHAEKMFGWRAEEVMGLDFFDFMILDADRPRLQTLMSKILQDRSDSQSVNWNLTRAGERILCDWMNAVLYDEHGQPCGVVALAVDITERARLQEQLRQSEQNFRTLTDSASFPVVVTALDDGRVLYINRRAADYFDISQQAAVGEQAPDYWADPAQRALMIERLRSDGAVSDLEVCLKRPRNPTSWVYLSATVTRFDGVAAAIVSFNDITERKRIELALRDSERRYRLLAENAFDVIWTMEPNGRLTYVSPSVERLRGFSVEEVLRQPLSELLTPDSFQVAEQGLRHLHETGEVPVQQLELEQPCKDGSTVWTDTIVTVVRDAEETPIELLGITRDITEQRRMREALHTRSVAIEAAAESVVITDANGVIEYVNPAFTRMTGYTSDEAIGNRPSLVKSGRHAQSFYSHLWGTITSRNIWRGEITNRRKDGSLYTEVMAIAPVLDASDTIRHYVAIKHDITERKDMEARLEHLAHFDVLTDLPNRALFYDRLGRAIAMAKRNGSAIGLLFIDLDGFKEVNDEHGHDVGDHLLRAVAQRLQNVVRESDTVARMGGDEFTVILKNITEPINAEAVAGKLVASLSQPFQLDAAQFRVGASIGIALYPQQGEDVETLVACADKAMYTVKRKGKNNYAVYAPTGVE